MTTTVELTRVNNDINGNPRYVCHFYNLLSDNDTQQVKEDFAATLSRNPFARTGLEYDQAVYKARKIGGKKFHNKQFGGGIVFQSYNTDQLIKDILEIQNS